MASWQTANPITWFKRLQSAFWDALNYLWDDQYCTWDAVSDSDAWNTPNGGTWYTKN